jgi:hypothetical protein
VTNFPNTSSEFAPLVISTSAEYTEVLCAFIAATASIPLVEVHTKGHGLLGGGLKQKPILISRKANYWIGASNKPYEVCAHLAETEAFEGSTDLLRTEPNWQVGLYKVVSGGIGEGLPQGELCFALELIWTRIVSNAPQGIIQLALLRHLWIENLKTYDPKIIVLGHGHDFDEEWWLPSDSAAQS